MLWNQIIRLEWGSCGGEKCSWGFTLLKLGIFIFLINCEISSAQQPSSSKSSYNKPSSHHSPWGSWSTSESSIHPWDEDSTVMPNIVPLTLKEQSIRESKPLKKSSQKQSHSLNRSQNPNNSKNGKSSKRDQEKDSNGKSGSRNNDDDADAKNSNKVDLAILRKQALEFGSLVVNFISNEMLPSQTQTAGESRGARGFLSDLKNNLKLERQEEGPDGEGGHHRGVIDWLARLIGVQGKTLGEFLREYQVHVLYDLVFTFFKWIFFLYAGLLIP